MRAAAYIRVSTEEQAEYSPSSQRKRLEEYAITHELTLLEEHIYVDEGISGRSVKGRTSFLRMIQAAKAKPRPFDVILVWKFSRFARNRQDSILYKSMLRKECGIEVVSVTEQLSDDPTAILVEALLEAMDEYYSINLAQEVRRGMNEKFSRGGVVSAPPFGYRMGIEDGMGTPVFVPDERAAPYVKMIFEDFCGGLSPRRIAGKLGEMRILTARGNPFDTRGVEYILSNPIYIGKQRRRTKIGGKGDRLLQGDGVVQVLGRHHPIISEAMFEQVQKILGEKRRALDGAAPGRPANGKAYGEYMLHGLVRCGSCGNTLSRTQGGRALQCHRYAKGLCTQSHYVSLEKLDRCVLDALERDLSPVKKHLLVAAPGSSHWEREEIRAALALEEKNLERAYAAYEAGIDGIEEYGVKKKAIRRRMAEWEKEAARKKAMAGEGLTVSLDTVLGALRSPLVEEEIKNELLRCILGKIVFSKPENTVTLFYLP